jgi:hypothetical protein
MKLYMKLYIKLCTKLLYRASVVEPSYTEPSHAEPSYAEPSYEEPSYAEPSCRARLADKQAKPCLLACLLVLAGSKQASKRPYFGQSSKQREGLLACLLVYCLYVVNLIVAVVGNRPLVF